MEVEHLDFFLSYGQLAAFSVLRPYSLNFPICDLRSPRASGQPSSQESGVIDGLGQA